MTSSQSKAIGPQGVAMLNMDGTRLRLEATEADTQVLLLSGEPIDEPIAARGPFVMNTYVQEGRYHVQTAVLFAATFSDFCGGASVFRSGEAPHIERARDKLMCHPLSPHLCMCMLWSTMVISLTNSLADYLTDLPSLLYLQASRAEASKHRLSQRHSWPVLVGVFGGFPQRCKVRLGIGQCCFESYGVYRWWFYLKGTHN